MVEKFPFTIQSENVCADDYFTFSTSFAEIVTRHIPTIEQVTFFDSESDFLAGFQQKDEPSPVDQFRLLVSGETDYFVNPNTILLRFQTTEGKPVIAVLSGADPLFLKKVSPDWLVEKKSLIDREFLLLKQARVDMQTGLLNLANLRSILESTQLQECLQLVFVELPPGTTSLRHGVKHLYRCVSLLKNFVNGRSILHYLGQHTFALLLQQGPKSGSSSVEAGLVAYLKKGGCPRVHVGSSKLAQSMEPGAAYDEGLHLLDEAWTALQRAVQKGPFSFCEYHHIAFPEKQPLAPPKSNLVRKIGRWIAPMDSFAIILFRGDNEKSIASEIIPPMVDDLKRVVDGDDVYVLVPYSEKQELQPWLEGIIDQSSDGQKAIHISAGVCIYPYGDLRKSEAVFSAKKALLHAHFFGPSSYAIFDHLSLNISGDVYFGDGDFNLAIKEYKRGLKCGGGDVNLFNSLGVSLVMMNRIKTAVECFTNALKLESTDFMALYNLGLTQQSLGRKEEAVSYFSKAYNQRDNAEVDPHLLNDLRLQLGILHCETGDYKTALTFIEGWLQHHRERAEAGRVHYYLGLCYFHLGRMKKAMRALEAALRFNGFDDRALNLLGRVYNRESQGEELAVILCEKSVELDPDNTLYKLYLAETYVAVGNTDSARRLFKKCLRRKLFKAFAQILMGESYLKEADARRARGWFEKAVTSPHLSPELKKRANSGLKACKTQ